MFYLVIIYKISAGQRKVQKFWKGNYISTFFILQLLHVHIQILGVCPGDKIKPSEDATFCKCPPGSIEIIEDKCLNCVFGENVANEDQTKCVGM